MHLKKILNNKKEYKTFLFFYIQQVNKVSHYYINFSNMMFFDICSYHVILSKHMWYLNSINTI